VAVAAAGWFLGRRYGLVAAVLAAAAWTYADTIRRPPELVRFAYWNGFTRLAIFVFAGFVMARIRSDERRLRRSRRVLEEEIIRARTDVRRTCRTRGAFSNGSTGRCPTPSTGGFPSVLACIDIEGLEKYRDGHEAGSEDDLVRAIALVLRRAVRASDIPARLDRDEFAVAFWDVERDAVEKTLRRVVAGVEADLRRDPRAPIAARIGLVRFAELPDGPARGPPAG
jgi:GGDEF domain-containing protein